MLRFGCFSIVEAACSDSALKSQGPAKSCVFNGNPKYPILLLSTLGTVNVSGDEMSGPDIGLSR